MVEVIEENGTCEECGVEINLGEAWRVDEKYYCQKCFEELDL
ncbi:MAG: hypothetical protein ACFE96_09430 [Candidatus Hermodarchaeota archaeon]